MSSSEHPEHAPRRYELEARIAGGGMGEVYRARAFGAAGFEKAIAIKRILRRFAQNRDLEERFVREAKLAAELTHANLIQVFDFGRLDGDLFIAMELCDGPDLRSLERSLESAGTAADIGICLYVGMEACKGLQFAHDRGVVHRDISPSNILLSRAGEVKIADFGIARVFSRQQSMMTGEIAGKFAYMAPEQARGERVDERSDLFSLGIVLWELIVGERLSQAASVEEALEQWQSTPPPLLRSRRPDVPEKLEEAVAAALVPDRADRCPGASALLRRLTEVCFEQRISPTASDLAKTIADLDLDGAPAGKARRVGRAQLQNLGFAPATEGDKETVALGRRTFVVTSPEAGAMSTLVEVGSIGEEPTELAVPAEEASSTEPVPPFDSRVASARRWRGPAVAAAVAVVCAGVAIVAMRGGTSGRSGSADESVAPSAADRAAAADPGDEKRARSAEESNEEVVVRAASAEEEQDGGAEVAKKENGAPTVRVDSVPAKAELYLDGELLGETPYSGPIEPGTHELELRLAKYHRKRQTIEVAPGAELELGTLKLRPVTHEIRIHVKPWAYVHWNGRRLGTVPGTVRLPEGTHRVRLVNPHVGSKTVRVQVPRREPYQFRLTE